MVTLISPSKNGPALIRYLIEGEGHDGSAERNLYVDTIGLLPSRDARGYVKQFRKEWANASPRHKVQCRHIIMSPSDKEIPYVRTNAVKFAEIVKQYVKTHYPNRRAIICVQQDGKGFTDENGRTRQILHAHVALSDCDIYECRGVEKEKTGFKYLSRTFDDFITERYGIEIDAGRDLTRRRYLKNQLVKDGERDDEGKFLSYQDDIKDRIGRCIAISENIDDFYNNLSEFGLSVEQKLKKKTGEQYQTYYLHDLSNISDGSKDCNGSIKAIAKKNQLPAMRSYRQKGFRIGEIEDRIRDATSPVKSERYGADTKAAPTPETGRGVVQKARAARGTGNRITHNVTTVSGGPNRNMAAALHLLHGTEEIINRLAEEQALQRKADKRYSEAAETVGGRHPRVRQKTL